MINKAHEQVRREAREAANAARAAREAAIERLVEAWRTLEHSRTHADTLRSSEARRLKAVTDADH
jgi:hypothetical protein